MSSFQEMYRQKLVAPEEAAKAVKSGDVIWAPPASNEPIVIWKAIAARKDELKGVVIRQFLSRHMQPHMDPSYAPHIFIESLFLTDKVRDLINEGYGSYVPTNFGDIPAIIRASESVDILALTVSPMDEHGYVTFGLGCDYTPAAIERAKIIIAEVNPNMPRTYGHNSLHISKVDYILECNESIAELAPPVITDIDRTIGAYIADRIEDGSTLQIGIGGVPAAVCKFLEVKKDLGIHTELISDYLINMVECGSVNGSKKSIHKGKVVATIVEGTRKLFDWLRDNRLIELHPVDYTNNVNVISQNHKMVSINATIEVDLFGQCASEGVGPKVFGGSGGQADFARGVTMAPGGQGFIVAYSTAKNGTISKIVPNLTPGASVTTTRTHVDHVVTEYGVAKLRGKSVRQRALALIEIAHPDFRDQLRHSAKQMKII
jgi:4-hydroxybutyrate CoA-transferase